MAIQKQRRRLLFTSAGAGMDLTKWLPADRSYDVWVAFRGQEKPSWQPKTDLFEYTDRTKFSDFKSIYDRYEHLIKNYDAIFLIDDDMVISAEDIEKLYDIRDRFDLWILQPAFSRSSKISHAITLQDGQAKLRYTNFVEMGVVLFERSKLDEFMSVYDPTLLGYGVDWWYIDHLGPNLAKRVAIVDGVACVNPLRSTGGIDEIQPLYQRIQNFLRIKKEHGISADDLYREELKMVGYAPHGIQLL